MTLNDKWYQALKWATTTLMPALATLVAALGTAWGYSVESIVVTITAVNAFLGAMIMRSSANFKKAADASIPTQGTIWVSKDAGGKTFTIEPDEDDLDKLDQQDHITMKVRRSS